MKVLKKALANTLKKPITIHYPIVPSPAPEGFRGRHKVYFNKCIGCSLCGKNCPTNAIKLRVEIKKEKVKKIVYKIVHHYIESINLGKCVFCGLCEDICPKDAIKLTRRFDMVNYDKNKTLIER